MSRPQRWLRRQAAARFAFMGKDPGMWMLLQAMAACSLGLAGALPSWGEGIAAGLTVAAIWVSESWKRTPSGSYAWAKRQSALAALAQERDEDRKVTR